jgi:hypothetical protein
MKNEIEWIADETDTLSMHLQEKGLNFKGMTAFMFYFSGIISMASMGWVIVLSVKMLQLSRTTANLPRYYVPIAMLCIMLSLFFIKAFYTMYNNRRKYLKEISIKGGTVHFKETTHEKVVEWSEKIKKFEEVGLRHYTYKGVESWFIALVHKDKSKSTPLFAPDYQGRKATEEEKRAMLAKYGTMFGIITTYEHKSLEARKQE